MWGFYSDFNNREIVILKFPFISIHSIGRMQANKPYKPFSHNTEMPYNFD